MINNIKIGDWVELDGYKGYYQVLSEHNVDDSKVFPMASDNGLPRIVTKVILKQGFTSTMKQKLMIEKSDKDWLIKLSPEKLLLIDNFFKENPDKYKKFLEYDIDKLLGDKSWREILYPDELALLENNIFNLPHEFTLNKFLKCLSDAQYQFYKESRNSEKSGKKKACYITIDLVPGSVTLAHAGLYTNPRIIREKQ